MNGARNQLKSSPFIYAIGRQVGRKIKYVLSHGKHISHVLYGCRSLDHRTTILRVCHATPTSFVHRVQSSFTIFIQVGDWREISGNWIEYWNWVFRTGAKREWGGYGPAVRVRPEYVWGLGLSWCDFIRQWCAENDGDRLTKDCELCPSAILLSSMRVGIITTSGKWTRQL